jgi:hypothetical protein
MNAYLCLLERVFAERSNPKLEEDFRTEGIIRVFNIILMWVISLTASMTIYSMKEQHKPQRIWNCFFFLMTCRYLNLKDKNNENSAKIMNIFYYAVIWENNAIMTVQL